MSYRITGFTIHGNYNIGPPLSSAELMQAQSEMDAAILEICIGGFDIKEKDAFTAAYIAGAVKIPYTQFRPSKKKPGSWIHISALERILEEVGLAHRQSVVISYFGKDATDLGAVARVYWPLKTAGFKTFLS